MGVTSMLKRLKHRCIYYVAPVILLTSFSCGGSVAEDAGRLAVYQARGQLFYQEKPAGGAHIVLHRVGASLPGDVRPNAHVDEDGSFQLTTYVPGDGAPAGEYAVTVTWPLSPSGPNPDPDLAPDRLKNRYSNPRTSRIRVRIAEEENVLKPIHLGPKP